MSLVSITELISGAVNSAADANATMTSWENASTLVDGQNIREEGVERRNIQYPTITNPNYLHRYNTNNRTVAIQSTSFFTPSASGRPVVLGSDGATGEIGIGPIQYNNSTQNNICNVRFSSEISISVTATTSGREQRHAQMTVHLCWGIFPGGPTQDGWTRIDNTFRVMQYGKEGGVQSSNGTRVYRASLTIAHRFDPLPTITTTDLFFGVGAYLDSSSGNQNCRFQNACLSAVTQRR
jgi:hypothetical protein